VGAKAAARGHEGAARWQGAAWPAAEDAGPAAAAATGEGRWGEEGGGGAPRRPFPQALWWPRGGVGVTRTQGVQTAEPCCGVRRPCAAMRGGGRQWPTRPRGGGGRRPATRPCCTVSAGRRDGVATGMCFTELLHGARRRRWPWLLKRLLDSERSRGGGTAAAWCTEARRWRRPGWAVVAVVRECQAVSVLREVDAPDESPCRLSCWHR
jgi:hypothetical protein